MRAVRRKKRDAPAEFDDGRALLGVQSPDGEVRGDAVRSLCPCHAGWEVFERHVGIVLRAMRDGDRAVRAHALHVYEDAARMRLAEESDYLLAELEEMTRGKRASRFRPGEKAPGGRNVRELRRRARRR